MSSHAPKLGSLLCHMEKRLLLHASTEPQINSARLATVMAMKSTRPTQVLKKPRQVPRQPVVADTSDTAAGPAGEGG